MPTLPDTELSRFSIRLDPDTSIEVIIKKPARFRNKVSLEIHGPINLERKHESLIESPYFDHLQSENQVQNHVKTLAQKLHQSIQKSKDGRPLFAGDCVTVLKEGPSQNAQSIVKSEGNRWIELVNGARFDRNELVHTTERHLSYQDSLTQKFICFFFSHTEEETPIGLRNQRNIEYQSFHWASIDILSPEDAPIALIETIHPNSANASDYQRVWRWHKNCLYLTEAIENTSFPKPGNRYPDPQPYYGTVRQTLSYEPGKFNQEDPPGIPGRANQSRSDRIEEITTWTNRRFILNGQIWAKTNYEPRHRIETERLTSLIRVRTQYAYDIHIDPRKYFRLDEIAAIEGEIENLKAEDENLYTKYCVEWDCSFEILIPESLHLQPQADGAEKEEQAFLKRYEQFKEHDLHRHLRHDPQEKIRALQMALADATRSLVAATPVDTAEIKQSPPASHMDYATE